MSGLSTPERNMVEIALGHLFPEMRDITARVQALTDPQVAHIAINFERKGVATTYVEADLRQAYDDILKGRVH